MTDDADCGDIFAIPKEIVFPDELSRYLREQVAVFARENALLQKNLEESERKLAQLHKESEELKNKLKTEQDVLLPSFASSTQTINSKIVELSKNYRNRCAELEKYKTKCSKLLRELEEIKDKEGDEDATNREPEPVKPPHDDTETKRLQDKLTATTSKMLEFKNTNMQLRNELRQAQKLLQQETGEDPSALLSNNWKGRAQVICDLQEKNRRLKEKLRSAAAQNNQDQLTNAAEKVSTKISTLENENADLRSQSDAHRARIETLKSRCAMLETALHELKGSMQNVKSRHSKDLEAMATVSEQLTQAELAKKNAVKEKDLEIVKLRSQVQNGATQIAKYKGLVEDLKGRLNEKSQNGGEMVNNQIGDGNNKAIEVERRELLDLVDLYKKKLENERNEHEKCQQLFRVEKQKAVRFEAAFARSELENTGTSRSRYSNTSQSSRGTENDLKSRLELAEENLKAIQTRLRLEQNERKQDFQEFTKILQSRIGNKPDA